MLAAVYGPVGDPGSAAMTAIGDADASSIDAPRRRRRPRWVVAVAVLALVSMTAGAAAFLASLVTTVASGGPTTDAATAFVAAWERRARGTWLVEGQSVRRRVDGTGTELRTPFRAVQRPPDRVVVQYGGVEAWLDGRAIGCTAAIDGGEGVVCADRGRVRPYDEHVDAELARVRAWVLGPTAAYRVADAGPGCFRLEIVRDDPAPPIGSTAEFCFDASTGAMRSSEVISVGVVDQTSATDVAATVRDEDLVLPPHRTA